MDEILISLFSTKTNAITCLLPAYSSGPLKLAFGSMEYPITGVFHSKLKLRFLGISIPFPLHRLAIRCLNNPILPLPKFHLKNTLNWQPFHILFDSGIPPLHPRSVP
ncbi:hypothetical protein ES288_A12G179800v1 [Gossypium darwinii]|uniref:Uncharacterized protein n=1 Tax=Gossypium darwinii TaxID=34276 RepID=A0A5D2EA79_GOSDA|nr:hypothetical protein ES288_A12G179800v1 [Gossypium darwinii]